MRSLVLLLLAGTASAQTPVFDRKEDVVYGRKFGTALTMDVFAPKDKEKANGAGIVYCVSGGWFSSKEMISAAVCGEFVKRGYVVFAVVHGSQPKFTIPEVLEDMHRAVRFIRHNAEQYGVDPERLGITGGSAGGHLSLMQGCAPKAGNAKAADPVERESSKVAAVACFYPPTDFLNYGKDGERALGSGILAGFRAPFDFKEMDPKTRAFVTIADEKKREEIGRAISPVTHVSKDSAPALIAHGDNDKLVPIQQAERIVEKLKAEKVPAKLVVKPGAAHGWANMEKERALFADWFDEHLAKKK